MKKEIAEKWVAALRSGEYKQGDGFLRSNTDKFCCLGVLCDLAVKSEVIPEPDFNENYSSYHKYDSNATAAVSSAKVREWSGLQDSLGAFWDKDGVRVTRSSLASMNDSGVKFAEIADIIEKHYEEL